MLIGFAKALKKMAGFRLGLGICANKRNLWYMALVIFFIEIFRLMRYMIIGAGYMLYFICAAIYKIYYYMVKVIVLACKKLHQRKKTKNAA